MAEVFIAYSGRNIKKVSQIVDHLSDALGRDRFWFAPDRLLIGDNIREQLSDALSEAKLFLNFESHSTAELSFSDIIDRSSLSIRDQLLLYEREEALRRRLKVINVALRGRDAISRDFIDYISVDMSPPLHSKRGKRSFKSLVHLVQGVL